MKIHEYQARILFQEYGIPVVEGFLAESPAEARDAAKKLGGRAVVKAQVLVGGRGKAGGVKIAANPDEAESAAREILGMRIQSLPVEKLLVTRPVEITQEFYLGLTVDRNAAAVAFIVSASGGVDIEELAKNRPEEIIRIPIRPLIGVEESVLRASLKGIFRSAERLDQAVTVAENLYRLFIEKDCSLVEINPYALVGGKELVALDAKVNLDDNALYKHPEMEKFRNPEEYSEDEIRARDMDLAFVSMEGEIGCIVNGAGLAMATMDIIKLFGGSPANFLDVGGSSSPEKVLNALTIIEGNPRVRAILINIFGGITRCDDIAQGIVMARSRIDLSVPLVIRLIGTNEEEGRAILRREGLVAAEELTDAVEKVVRKVKGV